MGFKDKVKATVLGAVTDEGAARRASQVAAMTAHQAADMGHSGTATAVALGGAAVVAASGAIGNYVYPPGDYATFD